MKPLFGYLFLAVGILTGIAANSFAKISDGFSKLTPTIVCILLMCVTMFSLAKAMSVIPDNAIQPKQVQKARICGTKSV